MVRGFFRGIAVHARGVLNGYKCIRWYKEPVTATVQNPASEIYSLGVFTRHSQDLNESAFGLLCGLE